MKNLGQRIKNKRLALKMTQKALAEKVGVAHVTISQWERQDTSPRGAHLFSLAEALNCEISWILRGDTMLNTTLSKKSSTQDFLTLTENVLLDLFVELPINEQEQLIKTLEEKKQHYIRLLKQLLEAKNSVR